MMLMLHAQRRHRAPCKRVQWDAGYTKCRCPLVIRGTLNGKPISVSTKRYLPREQQRDLEAARTLAQLWEKRGAVVAWDAVAQDMSLAPDPAPPAIPTIEMAVRVYLAQARDVGNQDAQLGKKKLWIGRRLTAFAASKGVRFLQEIDLNFVKEWRSTWTVGDRVRWNTQKMMLGFLWDCERSGWFPPNFAAGMTKGLGRIKVTKTETGYFPPDEYQRILDATYLYSDRPSIDKHNSFNRCGGDRIRALTELMRWTGLRIRDAVTLEKSRLWHYPTSGMWSVMVYQKKTGDPVYCPIPPDVAQLLLTVPASQKGNTNAKYFFWTGHGKPKTLVSNWERSFVKLFALVGLMEPDGKPKRTKPHMLRDTFAIESLLAGVPLPEVSKLLGHSSIRTTEESYMPWVRARQANLNQTVMDSWIRQGKVAATGTAKRATVIPIAAAR